MANRRMILPLSHFLKSPIQNWMCGTAVLIGPMFVHVDCSVPLEEVQEVNTGLRPTQKRGAGFRIVSLP